MPGVTSQEQGRSLGGLWVGVSGLGTGWAFSDWPWKPQARTVCIWALELVMGLGHVIVCYETCSAGLWETLIKTVIDRALPRQGEPPAMCGQDVGELGEAAVLWVNCPLGWTGGQISTISVFQERGPLVLPGSSG